MFWDCYSGVGFLVAVDRCMNTNKKYKYSRLSFAVCSGSTQWKQQTSQGFFRRTTPLVMSLGYIDCSYIRYIVSAVQHAVLANLFKFLKMV